MIHLTQTVNGFIRQIFYQVERGKRGRICVAIFTRIRTANQIIDANPKNELFYCSFDWKVKTDGFPSNAQKISSCLRIISFLIFFLSSEFLPFSAGCFYWNIISPLNFFSYINASSNFFATKKNEIICSPAESHLAVSMKILPDTFYLNFNYILCKILFWCWRESVFRSTYPHLTLLLYGRFFSFFTKYKRFDKKRDPTYMVDYFIALGLLYHATCMSWKH